VNYIHGLLLFMHKPIKNIHVGQKIEERRTFYEGPKNTPVIRLLKWVVIGVYPYFVKVRRYNEEGRMVNDTFCLGELVQMGYEPKGGTLL